MKIKTTATRPETEEEDFSQFAVRENAAKTIISMCLGLVLVFSSFALRYMNTGSWGLPRYLPPQSYEELLAKQAKLKPRQLDDVSNEYRLFKADNFVAMSAKQGVPAGLSAIAASERYLFKVSGNSVYAAEIGGVLARGEMGYAPAFQPPDEPPDESKGEERSSQLRGILVLNERLYAVYTAAEPATVTVYEFPPEYKEHKEHKEHNGAPSAAYSVDGVLREVIPHRDGVLLITDYVPATDAGIPQYGINGNNRPVAMEQIALINNGEPPYSNMSVIMSITPNGAAPSGLTAHAVWGNSADCIYTTSGGNGAVDRLVMAFYSARENRTHILRYRVTGGVLSGPTWVRVSGRVHQGWLDINKGVMRVAVELEEGAGLYQFDVSASNSSNSSDHANNSDAAVPLSRLDKIAAGERLTGVAFGADAVYIIAERVYPVQTTLPESPKFLNEVHSLIASDFFYPWGEERFFSVGVDTDQQGERRGITLTMYAPANGYPKAEQSYRLALSEVKWNDTIHTHAEVLPEAVAVDYNYHALGGVIAVPVSYFGKVTRVDSFYVLDYRSPSAGGAGFVPIGEITNPYAVDAGNAELRAAVIRGGVIYTFWGERLRSAAVDRADGAAVVERLYDYEWR